MSNTRSRLATLGPNHPLTRFTGGCAARLPFRGVTLSDRERALLDLETGWWRHAGDKETAIAETLGCPVGDYYAELNRLIDRPEAEEAYPLVVRRLRRLRTRRRSERSARRSG
jgi:hypothetical protein